MKQCKPVCVCVCVSKPEAVLLLSSGRSLRTNRFTRAWRSFTSLCWLTFSDDPSWWWPTPCSGTLEERVTILRARHHQCTLSDVKRLSHWSSLSYWSSNVWTTTTDPFLCVHAFIFRNTQKALYSGVVVIHQYVCQLVQTEGGGVTHWVQRQYVSGFFSAASTLYYMRTDGGPLNIPEAQWHLFPTTSVKLPWEDEAEKRIKKTPWEWVAGTTIRSTLFSPLQVWHQQVTLEMTRSLAVHRSLSVSLTSPGSASPGATSRTVLCDFVPSKQKREWNTTSALDKCKLATVFTHHSLDTMNKSSVNMYSCACASNETRPSQFSVFYMC